jgi:hypothetical protein
VLLVVFLTAAPIGVVGIVRGWKRGRK